MEQMLSCKRCSDQLPQSKVEDTAGIVHCPTCGAVFMLEPNEHSTTEPSSNIDIHLKNGQLEIVRRWYQPRMWLYVVMSICWFSILIGFWMLHPEWNLWLGIMMGFNAGFGLTLLYGTLCAFFNRTRIFVGEGHLEKRHFPLPWYGKLDIDTQQIDQIYCTERQEFWHGRAHTVYQLNVFLNNGMRSPLLRGIDNLNYALYLEQQIENFLDIQDRPMEGETLKKMRPLI